MSNAEKVKLAIEKLREAQNLINEAFGDSDGKMDHIMQLDGFIDDLEYDLYDLEQGTV
jgi:hypothetical protein